MREIVLIMCVIFGAVMVVTGAQADDYGVEAVYCRFDAKALGGGLLAFLKGGKCKVEVDTPQGWSFDVETPIVPERPDWAAIWGKFTND